MNVPLSVISGKSPKKMTLFLDFAGFLDAKLDIDQERAANVMSRYQPAASTGGG